MPVSFLEKYRYAGNEEMKIFAVIHLATIWEGSSLSLVVGLTWQVT